jgi:hypothetical protein
MPKKPLKDKGSPKPVTDTIAVRREAIADLLRIKEDFDAVVESLELMSDEEFMRGYKRSREQVKKREFGDWDAL